MNCQTCGTEVTDMKWEQDIAPVLEIREAWPGGPLYEFYGLMPKQEPVKGSQRYTCEPCGHEYRGGLKLTIDAAGTETYEMTSSPALRIALVLGG